MADSWDDEDFVPALPPGSKGPTSWEDEEEEEEEAYQGPSGPTEQQIAKQQQVKRKEAARIAAKLQADIQANETGEERRLRERRQAEETEEALAAEIFGNGAASGEETGAGAGVDGLSVKTLQEHVTLAIDIGTKLVGNKPARILAFLKEVTARLDAPLSLEETAELHNHIEKMRDVKRAAEAKKAAILKKQEEATKKRKDEQKKKKTHKDLFGGDYDGVGDDYDEMATQYEDQYDFM